MSDDSIEERRKNNYLLRLLSFNNVALIPSGAATSSPHQKETTALVLPFAARVAPPFFAISSITLVSPLDN
jgi:hypothetical protein